MPRAIDPMEFVAILAIALLIFSHKRISGLAEKLNDGIRDLLGAGGPPSGPPGLEALGRVPKLRRGGGPFRPA